MSFFLSSHMHGRPFWASPLAFTLFLHICVPLLLQGGHLLFRPRISLPEVYVVTLFNAVEVASPPAPAMQPEPVAPPPVVQPVQPAVVPAPAPEPVAEEVVSLEPRKVVAAKQKKKIADPVDRRRKVNQALARIRAKNEAEQAARQAEEAMTERERQETLLAAARARLQDEEAVTERAQIEVAALNQQIAALRAELGELQGLLDSAATADVASQVRIETLGAQLNQALARVAAEEKRRAELEAAEAERLRVEAERLSRENVDLADYRSEFFGTLRRVLGDREGIQIVGDRFVFSSEVLFESASATLAPAGREQIREVAGILSDVSDQIPASLDWIIRVDGHTDNIPLSGTGEFADNWELSQARALSVVRFMTDVLGFPPQRLAATGFGEYRPVDPSDTPEARAANRRIELKLTER